MVAPERSYGTPHKIGGDLRGVREGTRVRHVGSANPILQNTAKSSTSTGDVDGTNMGQPSAFGVASPLATKQREIENRARLKKALKAVPMTSANRSPTITLVSASNNSRNAEAEPDRRSEKRTAQCDDDSTGIGRDLNNAKMILEGWGANKDFLEARHASLIARWNMISLQVMRHVRERNDAQIYDSQLVEATTCVVIAARKTKDCAEKLINNYTKSNPGVSLVSTRASSVRRRELESARKAKAGAQRIIDAFNATHRMSEPGIPPRAPAAATTTEDDADAGHKSLDMSSSTCVDLDTASSQLAANTILVEGWPTATDSKAENEKIEALLTDQVLRLWPDRGVRELRAEEDEEAIISLWELEAPESRRFAAGEQFSTARGRKQRNSAGSSESPMSTRCYGGMRMVPAAQKALALVAAEMQLPVDRALDAIITTLLHCTTLNK